MLSQIGNRVQILEWAQRLESAHDHPRVNSSNQAVEEYLSGHISRRALRNLAYVTDDLRYETPGEAMAYFAAEVALAAGPASKPDSGWGGLLNEAISKAAEYGIRDDGGLGVDVVLCDEPIDPDFPDAHRWSPVEGETELAEWRSLLSSSASS